MTAIVDGKTRQNMLAERLATLQRQRTQALAETTPEGCGDDADRATNVEAHVWLAVLEERIAAVELELANLAFGKRRKADAGAAVHVGDVVTVDFGEGPEDYLLGSVEQAGDGVDVITPGSPLGRALLGAAPGATVEYAAANGRTLRAQFVAAA